MTRADARWIKYKQRWDDDKRLVVGVLVRCVWDDVRVLEERSAAVSGYLRRARFRFRGAFVVRRLFENAKRWP